MQVFGRYELLERIGIGGMAEVFRARSSGAAGVAKQLVIKKILPHLSEDEHFRNMFLNEAKIAVNLTHANIVQVFDFGEVDAQYFLAMEFIEGTDLRQILKDLYKANSRIPLPYALYIASEVCKGLDYAHRKTDEEGQPLGIIHRDISPQNILISVEGEVKVADFGIAKAANVATETRSGAIKGKLSYLAPEHISKGEADRRSDLFALGVCLHEMLTGKPLFAGRGELEILKRIESGDYPKPSEVEPWLPKSIDDVVMRGLERAPEDRYQTAAEFHEAIGDIAFEAGARLEPTGLASFIREHFHNKPRGTPIPPLEDDAQIVQSTKISNSSADNLPESTDSSMSFLTQNSASGSGSGSGIDQIPQQPLAMEIQQGDLSSPAINPPPSAPPTLEPSSPRVSPMQPPTSRGSGPRGVMPRERPTEERSARSLTIPPSRQAVSFVGKRDFNWQRYGVLGAVIIGVGALILLSAVGVIPVKSWTQSLLSSLGPNETPTPSADRVRERLAEFRQEYGTVETSVPDLVSAAGASFQTETLGGFDEARVALEKALVVDPENATALAALAEVYAIQSRYAGDSTLIADALQFAEAALRRDPDSIVANRAKAFILASVARTNPSNAEEAARLMQKKVLPKTPDDPNAKLVMGMALASLNPSQAPKYLQDAINGGLKRARYELALVYKDQGHIRQAAAELKKLRRQYGVADLERARLLEQMGSFKSAVAVYGDAAAVSGQSDRVTTQANLSAAIVHYQALGSPRTAQRILEQEASSIDQISEGTLRNRVRVHLSHVYRQQNKYDSALRIAKEAIADSDLNTKAASHFAAGMAMWRKKDTDAAGKLFTTASQSSLAPREKAEVLYYLALAQASHSSRFDEARQNLDRAARLDPHSVKATVLNGLILLKQKRDEAAVLKVVPAGRTDPFFNETCKCFSDFVGDDADLPFRQAVSEFEKLANERRSYDANAWAALGVIRFHAGDRAKAYVDFERALQEDPSNDVARLYRGIKLLQSGRGNYASAAAEIEKAKTSSASAYMYTELGRIYATLNNTRSAESNIARALKEDPDYAPALYWEGRLHYMVGRRSAAVDRWNESLVADPDYTVAAKALYDLGS